MYDYIKEKEQIIEYINNLDWNNVTEFIIQTKDGNDVLRKYEIRGF